MLFRLDITFFLVLSFVPYGLLTRNLKTKTRRKRELVRTFVVTKLIAVCWFSVRNVKNQSHRTSKTSNEKPSCR